MNNIIKYSIIFIILLFIPTVSSAYNLSGYVVNTIEYPISAARVDLNNTNHVFTDANGYYEFTNVDEGNYTLLVRQIGYRNNSQIVNITGSEVLNITLYEKISATKLSPGFESFGLILIILTLFFIKRK